MSYTLTPEEIKSLPAGRLLNTLVEEYIFGRKPSRWSNGQQKSLPAHWFEELPRSCAEDDGDSCPADFIPKYSSANAMPDCLLGEMQRLGYSIRSEMEGDIWYVGFIRQVYSTAPSPNWDDWKWHKLRMPGSTFAIAICRAALLAHRHD